MKGNSKTDYSSLMYEEIARIESDGTRPKLLLHLCCAPCSLYVIELLYSRFELVCYFYDPNIHPVEEYIIRRDEARSHAESRKIRFVEGPYDADRWREVTAGHESDPEKGVRCRLCYAMRLREAARFARESGCEYFTTVLSISPHKDAKTINEIGFRLCDEFGVKYLPADFKKRDGFKKSVEMSGKYGFYRQKYCGCVYSRR